MKSKVLTATFMIAAFACLHAAGQVQAAPFLLVEHNLLNAIAEQQSTFHKAHGWHCRARGGPGWRHRHRAACGPQRKWKRCRRARNRCANRWGWGSWRWHRCVQRRGC